MITGDRTVEIDAPIQRCFDIAADIEHAPKWQGSLKDVEVLSKDADGRAEVVETESDAKVKTREGAAALQLHASRPGSSGCRRRARSSRCAAGGTSRISAAGARARPTRSRSIPAGCSACCCAARSRARCKDFLLGGAAEGLKREAEGAVMKRLVIAALAAALVLPAAAAAPAGAKTKRVCKTVKVHGHKRKRCHRVKVKPKKQQRIPVTATVLDGSSATLDFGNGTVRTVGAVGQAHRLHPRQDPAEPDTKAILNGGQLAVAPTDFFSDGCASPGVGAVRSGDDDPARPVEGQHRDPARERRDHLDGERDHPRRARHAPGGRLRPAARADRLHRLDRVRQLARRRSGRAA